MGDATAGKVTKAAEKASKKKGIVELGKLSALEYTPECYAYSQSHHLCRPVSERPLYYLSLTLDLSLFLSMLQKLVRILLSDWILLHCFHRKEFRRKASLSSPVFRNYECNVAVAFRMCSFWCIKTRDIVLCSER